MMNTEGNDVAIAIFAYNRPELFLSSIKAIRENANFTDFRYFIFIDGPKTELDLYAINEVNHISEEFILGVKGQIFRSQKNEGLKESVVKGLDFVFSKYESAIVLEDDIEVSSTFLNAMRTKLQMHCRDQKIGSITGLSPSSILSFIFRNSDYLASRHSSWGWATWADRWNVIEWDVSKYSPADSLKYKDTLSAISGDLGRMWDLMIAKKIDSWSIIFDANMARRGYKCLYSGTPLIQNLGFQSQSTHFSNQSLLSYLQRKSHLNIKPISNKYVDSSFSDLQLKWQNSRFYYTPKMLRFLMKKRILRAAHYFGHYLNWDKK